MTRCYVDCIVQTNTNKHAYKPHHYDERSDLRRASTSLVLKKHTVQTRNRIIDQLGAKFMHVRSHSYPWHGYGKEGCIDHEI